jgi:hypothetical protein
MYSGCLVYNNKMWIIAGGAECTLAGGVKSDVWSSSNGAAWTEATASAAFGQRWGVGAVVFNNKMWVIGGLSLSGYLNDVWSSTDGATWTKVLASAPFAGRENFGCLVYNNMIWVIGGDNTEGVGTASDTGCALSDVWSSPDGVNWTLAGQFPESRAGASCVVFNGAMWVISGGNTYPNPAEGSNAYTVYTFNDSWSSTDGANWTQATSNAAFPGRSYAAAQVFNGQIWLLGGAQSSYLMTVPYAPNYDDVWVSSDGANWTETYPTLPFNARFAAESCVYNNSFWLIGGCQWVASPYTCNYFSDVWHNP